jgi:hypothetical protein
VFFAQSAKITEHRKIFQSFRIEVTKAANGQKKLRRETGSRRSAA